MRSRLVVAIGAAAAAAFLAAGCGGGGAAVGAGAEGGAATVAPADSVAFVAIDSDLGSSRWKALDGLLGTLTGNGGLVATLRQALEQKTGLSWANDIAPAIGSELDLAVLPAVSGGKPQAVLLTQPADPSKLDALLGKLSASGGTKPVSAQVGGWTAVADSQAALDAVSAASSHLGDDTVYQEATSKLDSGALVRAYANGAEARQLVSALGGTAPTSNAQLVWASADVVPASGGLRVDGFVRSDGAAAPQTYDAALPQKIPSGALLVADFQADRLQTAGAPAGSSPLGTALQKVAGALGGETALYVSPAAPIPAVTLVTQPTQPQAVIDGLHDVLTSAGSLAGGANTGGFDLGTILGALTLSHRMVGSDLVVSTSQQQVDAFAGGGKTLAEDPAFTGARSASGMPAATAGFVYANLADALPAVQALAKLAGATVPGGLDLSTLQTLTAFDAGSSGGISRFGAFLQVG